MMLSKLWAVNAAGGSRTKKPLGLRSFRWDHRILPLEFDSARRPKNRAGDQLNGGPDRRNAQHAALGFNNPDETRRSYSRW